MNMNDFFPTTVRVNHDNCVAEASVSKWKRATKAKLWPVSEVIVLLYVLLGAKNDLPACTICELCFSRYFGNQ